jgi:hypothetical protein
VPDVGVTRALSAAPPSWRIFRALPQVGLHSSSPAAHRLLQGRVAPPVPHPDLRAALLHQQPDLRHGRLSATEGGHPDNEGGSHHPLHAPGVTLGHVLHPPEIPPPH